MVGFDEQQKDVFSLNNCWFALTGGHQRRGAW